MKEEMKLYEVRLDENGFRFRHANPRPLTAEQKASIALALIICPTICFVVSSFLSLFRG